MAASRDELITAYIDAGLVLVPIPDGRKGPTSKGWNLPENAIRTRAEAACLNGHCNFGLAHAYCTPSPTCALDVDDIDKARPWLAARGVNLDDLLAAPDAVRINSGREGRAKLLYRLTEPMVTRKPTDSGLELRCAAANGNTTQDVLPPSIHPDTGGPYLLHGNIGAIPLIPDALLAVWQAQGDAKPRGKRLDQVKTNDPILKTLDALGMVREDHGGGQFWITCPFEGEHTNHTGAGETTYFLPHTGGFAQGHFKCLHAHCEGRSDNEFMLALLARFQRETGKAPLFGVAADSVPAPTAKTVDAELNWLIGNAPVVVRAYIAWYLGNAIRPHPVFALVSALLFIQALIGRNVTLPRGTRPNLWLLLLAPTESGKGDVPRLATNALEQISASKVLPSIPQFDEAFGSAEGLWWHLEQTPQAIWLDEELAKTLAAVIAAPEGSPRYALRRALLVLYDAATRAQVAPIRYSRRVKASREMQPLHYPFLSVIGTGVPRDIASFSAAAADDGLLNRFLVVVVEDLPAVGSIRPPTPLPDVLVKWAGKLYMTGALEAMAQAANGPKTVAVYSGLDSDWAAEMEHGSALAQGLPGVWGRFAEKILKTAMLFAVADSGAVTSEAFEWGKRFVKWANSNFARHFEAEGGGAENELDAMAQAFMATFDVPALAGRDALSTKLFAQYAGRAWRNCKDSLKRRRVVEALIEDGRIEEIPLQPKGVAYRKLG
jgi:hypothetical protein